MRKVEVGRRTPQKVEEVIRENTGSLDVYCERMRQVASTADQTMALRVTVLEFAELWISRQ